MLENLHARAANPSTCGGGGWGGGLRVTMVEHNECGVGGGSRSSRTCVIFVYCYLYPEILTVSWHFLCRSENGNLTKVLSMLHACYFDYMKLLGETLTIKLLLVMTIVHIGSNHIL